MKVDNEQVCDACILHILATAIESLTSDEIAAKLDTMSESDKLDALARYQEHGG